MDLCARIRTSKGSLMPDMLIQVKLIETGAPKQGLQKAEEPLAPKPSSSMRIIPDGKFIRSKASGSKEFKGHSQLKQKQLELGEEERSRATESTGLLATGKLLFP